MEGKREQGRQGEVSMPFTYWFLGLDTAAIFPLVQREKRIILLPAAEKRNEQEHEK